MKIVADQRIAALDVSFGLSGELVAIPGREISPEILHDADALITRTVTDVNRALLDETSVRFVGTATIGTDHLDTEFLEQQGIGWAAAPGCNADATAQYTLAMYLLACQRMGIDPFSPRLGIVGCGNVGGRLRRLAQALGIDVIANDPPLAARGLPGFSPFEEILDCDVISVHVPLTCEGQWPTYRMFNAGTFAQMRPNGLLINACRGDVVEPRALSKWISDGGHAALDVWPGEPDIDPRLIELATVASPHIAGYSLDGKLRATSMVYAAFCEHFGLPDRGEIHVPEGPRLDLDSTRPASVQDVILKVCPVERDDSAMRERLGAACTDRIAAYDALRSHYPERRDFAAWSLAGRCEPELETLLRKLGFAVSNR